MCVCVCVPSWFVWCAAHAVPWRAVSLTQLIIWEVQTISFTFKRQVNLHRPAEDCFSWNKLKLFEWFWLAALASNTHSTGGKLFSLCYLSSIVLHVFSFLVQVLCLLVQEVSQTFDKSLQSYYCLVLGEFMPLNFETEDTELQATVHCLDFWFLVSRIMSMIQHPTVIGLCGLMCSVFSKVATCHSTQSESVFIAVLKGQTWRQDLKSAIMASSWQHHTASLIFVSR